MSKKIYILDTNVLLHDSNAILSFQDNTVIIPLTALSELDTFKKGSNEQGRNARKTSRILDNLRTRGTLTNGGVTTETGGTVKVALACPGDFDRLPEELRNHNNGDNTILAIALRIVSENVGVPVVLVTKDINFRIKGAAVGLRSEDYKTDKVVIDDLYDGTLTLSVSKEDVDRAYSDGSLQVSDLCTSQGFIDPASVYPNQCLCLVSQDNTKQSALMTVSADKSSFILIKNVPRDGFYGITPRNREQTFALALLADPAIRLVSLIGKAGTGKTLLAISTGLHQTVESGLYRKTLVSRPVFPMGRDLGFLPGDIDEKLAPWMQPIYDNLDLIIGHDKDRSSIKKGATKSVSNRSYLFEMGALEVEPLTYIRGRSIPQQYLIVDEAQNLTPQEIKTIITRAGEDTKIVLTGDPAQIDNPYVDASSNGLTYAAERLKGTSISGHITLMNGERSELAEIASNLL